MADRETAAGKGQEAPVAASAGAAAAVSAPPGGRETWYQRHATSGLAMLFMLPALFLLAALVLYPILYTVWRSLYDKSGSGFVGLENYVDMFKSDATRTAIKNNAIWVLVVPTLVTALGLVFAVLAERVRWATAFKFVVFMPMAISFLAAGIIFTLVYESNPDRGVANAVLVGLHDTVANESAYPGARPRDEKVLRGEGGGFATTRDYSPGDVVALPLVAVKPDEVPGSAQRAALPKSADRLSGAVWLDFTAGGGGKAGQVDPTEKGLPGMKVQAVRDGDVVATTTTRDDGSFSFAGLPSGSYRLVLPSSNFKAAFDGVTWLGPTLATWSIIGAYVWMWAGFAMVLIAAGLSAIPRDALEAARVDGATEWQVFRRVTVPLLMPVLLVVVVTLMINVMKIFDLVFVLAPSSVQDDANVLALEMWRVSFGGGRDQGLGSALAVFLFLLVLPAMIFNIRRFRREQQ